MLIQVLGYVSLLWPALLLPCRQACWPYLMPAGPNLHAPPAAVITCLVARNLGAGEDHWAIRDEVTWLQLGNWGDWPCAAGA